MKNSKFILKRLFDLILSSLGLLILSPLFLVIAMSIKNDSKGPVFFEQKRIGLKGKTFRIFKFRTMVINAENIGDGISIKSRDDARITRTGRFLRKTSLDELPQLFNVLKGDMSLVGPRPPVIYFPYDGFESYPNWAKVRFTMKPGVTGLAQVTVRNSVSWDERIKVDLTYIRDFTMLLDCKIIMKTVGKIFKPDNIYLTYEKVNK